MSQIYIFLGAFQCNAKKKKTKKQTSFRFVCSNKTQTSFLESQVQDRRGLGTVNVGYQVEGWKLSDHQFQEHWKAVQITHVNVKCIIGLWWSSKVYLKKTEHIGMSSAV